MYDVARSGPDHLHKLQFSHDVVGSGPDSLKASKSFPFFTDLDQICDYMKCNI